MPVFGSKSKVVGKTLMGRVGGGLRRDMTPPKAPIRHEWSEARISVVTDDGSASIFADVSGKLAVHETLMKIGGRELPPWTVTSISTGLAVCRVTSKADAQRIAEVLNEDCRLILGKINGQSLVAALPEWVRPWIERCRDGAAFVEPPAER